MGLKLNLANRIEGLPPYLFAAIDQMKQEAIRQGKDIINLGVGDPDLPTPAPIIRKLQQAAEDPKNHQYPSYEGLLTFRQAVAHWYQRRFGVSLNPENEVLALIGSKEGIGHFPLAFINPGDVALIPTPGYPVYHAGTLFAGGKSHFLPLLKENHFLPVLEKIQKKVLQSARILFINYPNNPTSATASTDFFKSVVSFAERHNLIVCHDAAYSEIYYDGKKPASFLEVPGAREVGIEFHSLSKTFNMTGWRIGFAVGNREILAALGKVKSNLDSGVFQAVQEAGIYALSMEDPAVDQIRKTYQERRDVFVNGLRGLGFDVPPPQASFYVWVPVPSGTTSEDFTALLLSKAGIVSTPGKGFGDAGEGYVRMTLTVRKERLVEAIDRIEKTGIRGS
jgi:LL-diaminopimelate aminotransferase